MRTTVLSLAALIFLLQVPCEVAAGEKPNIVVILADDLGYGDVACLNPEGQIPTPNLDQLGREGMIFTDAHSSSAVCTPTRYGLLTGRYNWRTRLQSGVLWGWSPPLIDKDRLTVAGLLRRHGYTTACIGKWHLGMNWSRKNSQKQEDVDYTAPIADGPTARGFDYFFGISASLDMPPYVYIENDRVTQVPTTQKQWLRRGPAAEDFEAIDVLPRIAEKTVELIDKHAAGARRRPPMFIYMPLNSPHTPIVPTKQWKGKSEINAYADFVMQTDHAVGQVLDALDRNGLTDNTLVLFTSDNGCSPQAKFDQLAKHGHDPSHVFRGHKADIYEGGHRVPFVVRWPGRIEPGSSSDQTACLTDLMATFAEILGVSLPDDAGEDSVSLLPALRGEATKPLREATVHHSINGSFAIRQGRWKLVLCPGSGGWSNPRPGKAPADAPRVQLYDLDDDAAEQANVQAEHRDVVRRLTALLQRYVDQGRSNPGAPQSNDANIKLFKAGRPSWLDEAVESKQ